MRDGREEGVGEMEEGVGEVEGCRDGGREEGRKRVRKKKGEG